VNDAPRKDGEMSKKPKWTNRVLDFGVDAVVIGDYTSKRDGSFLAYLDKLSELRRDGGLYGGYIHYIQYHAEEMILKPAIQGVLDLVPSLFPLELPELVALPQGYQVTKEQTDAIYKINKGLLLPIDGPDIVEIIKLAREYAKPREGEKVN
jgi:hypothetical protein